MRRISVFVLVIGFGLLNLLLFGLTREEVLEIGLSLLEYQHTTVWRVLGVEVARTKRTYDSGVSSTLKAAGVGTTGLGGSYVVERSRWTALHGEISTRCGRRHAIESVAVDLFLCLYIRGHKDRAIPYVRDAVLDAIKPGARAEDVIERLRSRLGVEPATSQAGPRPKEP